MSDRSDFNDLARVAGKSAVAAAVSAAVIDAKPDSHASTDRENVVSIGDNWPDPIIPGQMPVPDLPASILPTWVGRMAEAVAESTQTPPAMAVMCALSVLATALHRRFEVAPFGEEDEYTEPLSLWTLTALPSGSRKTAVINALAAPLVHWEKLQRDRLRSEIARTTTARLVGKKRIEKLAKDAVNAESDEDRERIRKLIQEEEEAMPAEIRAPRLFTGDVTAERLQALLVEHGERMAVLSDEAGIFLIMAGLYSGGMASLDVFLQGHAGTPMRVDRADRCAHIDKPALTFGLALQPGVLADVASSRRFRDSGLLARFLFAMPESNVGKRDVRRRWTIPSYVKNDYESRLHALLDGRQQIASRPRVIGMSDPARELWLDFADEIEKQQGERGGLESIADWSSKLPGAAARIAALLELAEAGPSTEAVSLDATAKAVELCRLLIPHAQAAFGLLGGDATDTDAAAIIKWARDGRRLSFSRRDCQKAMEGRFRSVARLEKALERLSQSDSARVNKVPNKGAPPTTMVRMNPKLFVD
ncbi:YfjI family protein [Azonexus hydrophilus]|uniref:YfjI family protein n=1 Tax=Azonexus hydrophilus TaxID=418702 RepID=A0ABZ2XDT5_9RHOO